MGYTHGKRRLVTNEPVPESLPAVKYMGDIGLQPESILYFSGKIAGLRAARMHVLANKLEFDVTRLHELSIYFGWPIQCADAVRRISPTPDSDAPAATLIRPERLP